MTSGFRRNVDEICALLRCYGALSGNPLPTFRDKVSAPSLRAKKSNEAHFLILKDGTDMLCRNVSKGLPLDTA
jgi:hypothetical protein